MDRDGNIAAVAQKIAELTRRAPSEVRQERTLRELVQDSFALVEMVIELQEEFQVTLNQQDFVNVVTVQDLVTLISQRMPCE